MEKFVDMKNKKYIKFSKERVVLSDTLPYELPIIFSNRHFYRFLQKNKIEIKGNRLLWHNSNRESVLENIIKLLFGIDTDKQTTDNSIQLNIKWELKSIPLTIKINHKQDSFRDLSIPHPKNQLTFIEFYDKYKYLLLYYCKKSPFSIRKPHKVSKYYFYKDNTHLLTKEKNEAEQIIEEKKKDYESLKSFFTYKKYSNIYKFYESKQYQRCEKQYNQLLKFDIAQCFDSIYTHSITWALLGKDIIKENLGGRNPEPFTFGDAFDKLMQDTNYAETNGIIIGPEVSRIFAEIILQEVDLKVFLNLEKEDLKIHVDYEIYRYVDDFFVFFNDNSTKDRIQELYQIELKKYKLSLNSSKTAVYSKPIITEITIAKNAISELINQSLQSEIEKIEKDKSISEKLKFSVNPEKFITQFKAIIKSAEVEYKDIMNYSLVSIHRKVKQLINNFIKVNDNNEDAFCKNIISILDIVFFLYSVSPKVNTTIKLSNILIDIITISEHKKKYLGFDNKHIILKKISDEIVFILKKYAVKEYTQLETLYLLIVLKELGKEYSLTEENLKKYFKLDGQNNLRAKLNYFSITTLLFYMENDTKYAKIKDILTQEIMSRFKGETLKKRLKTSEHVLLMLDVMTCPYLDNDYKKEILSLYEIRDNQLQEDIINYQEFWFIKWKGFNLRKELNAKQSREVYA